MNSAQAIEVFEQLVNQAIKQGIFGNLKDALICNEAINVLKNDIANRNINTSNSDTVNNGNS
jgi:hypothetical protein